MSNKLKLLTANWNAPKHIQTLITTRIGGVSNPPFNSLNLAKHVNDDLNDVKQNRKLLLQYLPSKPFWLNQTHSHNVLDLNQENALEKLTDEYDASITTKYNTVCAIMTADCIPILLTDTDGSFVAAIHAGWKGVLNGVIYKTLDKIKCSKSTILAYIGPSICTKHFEVAQDLLDQFITMSANNKAYFYPKNQTKFECDLVGIAKSQLLSMGIFDENIYLSNNCTYCNDAEFYSFRRDGITGRIAHLIWISEKKED